MLLLAYIAPVGVLALGLALLWRSLAKEARLSAWESELAELQRFADGRLREAEDILDRSSVLREQARELAASAIKTGSETRSLIASAVPEFRSPEVPL